MANVDGTWAVAVKTPMGDQKSDLTVTSSGDTFTGTMSGAMGSNDVSGTVDGDTLIWSMDITSPMPMTLDNRATVDGDSMTGTVKAGAFGGHAAVGRAQGLTPFVRSNKKGRSRGSGPFCIRRLYANQSQRTVTVTARRFWAQAWGFEPSASGRSLQ